MLRPHFVGSFPRADVSLDPPLPELALIGRSNVGKSSLLNALAGRRIAHVSRTPGKTRTLNVYEIPARGPVGAQHAAPLRTGAYYLLDLPGYGYAKAGKTERADGRGCGRAAGGDRRLGASGRGMTLTGAPSRFRGREKPTSRSPDRARPAPRAECLPRS